MAGRGAGGTRPAWSVDESGLSLRHAERACLGLHGAWGSVSIGGEALSLADARMEPRRRSRSRDGRPVVEVPFVWPGRELRWTWRIEEADGALRIAAELANTGPSPVRVGEWHVLDLDRARGGVLDLGEEPANVRFFGWRPWDMRVERLAGEEGAHGSNNLLHLYDAADGTALLCGFVTLDRMLVRHDLDCGPGGGVRRCRATCRFGDYGLPPGEEMVSETLHVAYHDDPYAALESWADAVRRIYAPAFEPVPPVIYSGTTWLHVWSGQEGPWETVLLEGARAVKEKLAGFRVDCLSGTTHHAYRDGIPGNWYEFNEEQFPGGLEVTLEKLWAMGFAHKFWFFAEAHGVLEENRENLLRDASGEPIAEPATWEWDTHGDADDSPRLTKYYLDGTHPKTQDYVRRIF